MPAKLHTTNLNLVAAIGALVVWLAASGLCVDARCQQRFENPSDELVNVRLRVTWGGGTPKVWHGNVHFHDATIQNPAVLGVNIESPASLDFQPHAVRIKQLVDSTFEGFDVDVRGHAEGQISFQLSSPGQPVQEFQLTLSDIIQRTKVYPLDDSNNRISFERSDGDQIRLTTDREHMIFSAGEAFEFELQANCLAEGDQDTHCIIEIVNANKKSADKKSVISHTTIALPCSKIGTSDLVKQFIAVPSSEGVYEIRFRLDDGNEIGLIPSRKRPVIRSLQLVVLEDQPFEHNDAPWSPKLELKPEDLRQTISQQVNQLSRIVGVGGKSGAIGKFSISDQPEPSVVLPVGGWQSITLDIDDPDAKHLIELDYNGRQPMSLGLSLLVPDENGSVSNFGFDSGFSVEDAVVGTANPVDSVHRFTFIPDAKRVVLLIANRDNYREARFNGIRLLKRPKAVPHDAVETASGGLEAPIQRRRMMVMYEQPLFAENFGVRSPTDATTGQPISDWSTFYHGAKRLVSHLHDIGAGGAFINVLGEGSSLAPLKTVSSSPRYDTGVFSTSLRETMKKDVVELLYRLFERENLRFVPLLTFDQPLSPVEFMNSADAKLVDYRGLERGASEYELPRYNPLAPSVQKVVNSIVEEFASRYSVRDGYSGIALACRPDTCTLLPGSRHAGYDQQTIERFQQDLGISNQSLTGNELLSATHAPSWLQWRNSQMSEWYQQISRICTNGKRDAKCYLALIDITRNEEFSSILSPALHHSPDISQTMLRMGLASDLATKRNKIVLMQPHRYAPVHPLSSQKSEFEMQNNSQFADWFGKQQDSASLFYNRSAWARFENLENSSLFGKNPDPILRLQQLSRASRWCCQPLAQALLDSDPALFVDGGLLLNSSASLDRKEFLEVYSKLASETFEDTKHATHSDDRHPVAVRFLNTGAGTEIYLVNASPWQVEVTVNSNMVVANGLVNFGQKDWLPVDAGSRPHEFQVTLEPFQLVGGRVADNRLKLNGFSYALPESAKRDLNASYYKLRSKLIASANAIPLQWLANSGFEQQTLENWTTGTQIAEFASVDTNTNSFEGSCALRLRNSAGQNVWIRSDVIPTPETGRLSISVWLRLGDEQEQPPLRISVESDDPSANYYRFAEVGSLDAESGSSQLSSDWRQFAVHFDDLPQQPLNGLRIGFDLIGPGDVWVDHVQVFDRWLDENDAKAVTQLLASIGPLLNETETLETCRSILRSYWPTFLRQYFQDEANAENVADIQSEPVRSSMRQRFRRFVSPGIFQFR